MAMSEATDIADILRGLRALKRLVEGETRGVDPRWVDQANSTLGRRTHIEAVKRRLNEARAKGINPRELGAAVDGRRYLLSQESMAEELGNREAAGIVKARARKAARELAEAEANAGESLAYHEALAALQAAGRRR